VKLPRLFFGKTGEGMLSEKGKKGTQIMTGSAWVFVSEAYEERSLGK
jgi:hypothetical protein